MHQAIHLFFDEEPWLSYSSIRLNEEFFVLKHECHDNVIPASNSVMAMVVYKMGRYFENEDYTRRGLRMLGLMQPKFAGYPSGYSQWMQLQLLETFGLKTVCITGPKALEIKNEFDAQYVPNAIFAGGENSAIPIMKDKVSRGEDHIHVCTENACMPAVGSIDEAVKLLEQ